MKSEYEEYFNRKHNVLNNKLGLTNPKLLHMYESEMTSIRTAQLKEVLPTENFDISDLKRIHFHLFQDVYKWAGEYREVNMKKGDTHFLPFSFFHNAEEQMNNDIKSVLNKTNASESFICENLGSLLIDLNYMHPFREGNGRTQREFIRQLAEIKGYVLNISTDNELYMEACIEDDKVKMHQAIKKNIRVKEIESIQNKVVQNKKNKDYGR